jgi:hypothetical protein
MEKFRNLGFLVLFLAAGGLCVSYTLTIIHQGDAIVAVVRASSPELVGLAEYLVDLASAVPGIAALALMAVTLDLARTPESLREEARRLEWRRRAE